MSYIIKKNKETMFNQDINKLFLVTLGSNTDFIKLLTGYIHNSILEIVKSNDYNNKAKDSINNIIELVTNHFIEKDMFNLYYEKLLEQRLLNNKYNIELEKQFIMKFNNNNNDNKVIHRMIYKLEDMEVAERDKVYYDNLKFSVESNKFKGKINEKELNIQKIKFNLLRNNAWTSTSDNTSFIEIPFDMQPYTDMYLAYCSKKYPHRHIQYNFEYGVGVLKFNLNDNQYFIQLTIPQMFLLLQFNDTDKIKAHEIATNMGIPLSKLGPVLSSLLKSQLLVREPGKNPNDKDMFIFLNRNFKYNGSHFSLVQLMNNPKKEQSNQKQIDEQIAHQVKIEKETIVRATVVRTMKKEKTLGKEALMKKVSELCKFNITEECFSNVFTSCIDENYIKNTDENTFEYVEDDDFDDD